MKTIILARVSTEEQKEAGNSLPAQLFRLRKYAQEHELKIYKEFEFDESAYKIQREEFSEVMEELKTSSEKMAVLCDKVDRLIRNFTADLVTLEELRREGKIELHFPSDNIILHKDSPAADLFRFTIGVSLAKYYSDTISDNVKRAIGQKIRVGNWAGKAPIGYKNVEKSDETKWVEVDLTRADTVRKLFEWYATGTLSMELLRRKAQEEGLTNNTELGKPLTKSQIDHILKNPFYYGEMRWNGKLYNHKYTALITKELYNKVQKVKQNWHKVPFQYAAMQYLFRGLLSCANCGCAITFETAKGKYIYGHCTNFHKNCSKKVWMREEVITNQVVELLKNLTVPEDVLPEIVDALKKGHQDKIQYHNRIMDNLKQELSRVENRLDNLLDAKLDGSITQETYDRKLKQYKEQQQEILDQMDRHNKADENFFYEANKILELSKRAYEIFANSEMEDQRELLKFLLPNSKMDGENLVPSIQMPFDVIINCHKTKDWLPR
ncbi:hypothetical protein A2W15_02575 [Candidatus Woesebacteria bacterium RBG_16_41_13]|nr:MAG: hypothetical protein A2W15_02575 [Candidatus Woesebacteria bacterium RBG_16_41_13]